VGTKPSHRRKLRVFGGKSFIKDLTGGKEEDNAEREGGGESTISSSGPSSTLAIPVPEPETEMGVSGWKGTFSREDCSRNFS